MEFLMDNWGTIILAITTLLGVFKWAAGIKYVNFAKEVGDIYISYQKGSAKDSPGGKSFTDQECLALGREVVEAVEKGEVTFKK